MKHQGKYGFTWDSKAEEWAAWAVSCLDHNAPRSWRERRDLARFANDMLDEHDAEARHKPAQRDLVPETYRPLPHQSNGHVASRKAPLWPIAAIAVVAAVAAAIVWTWG